MNGVTHVFRRDVACYVSLTTSPPADQQPVRRTKPAFLILVIRPRCPIANLFVALPRNPSVQRAFQRVALRSPESPRPKKRISTRRPHGFGEELFAGAG